MKIEIQVAKLNCILKNVAKAIEARNISDWMCGVLLEATANGMLTATATNVTQVISQRTPCAVSEEGKVCLDGKLLINIAAKLSADVCTISSDAEKKKATICAKGSKTTVAMLNDNWFSEPADETEHTTFQVSAKDWINALKQVHYAIPVATSRPQLESANISSDGSGVVNVCGLCDNRMALCKLKDIELAESININIPKKTVSDMIAIITPTKDMLTIVTDGKHITISTDELSIKSVLNIGSFTDYRRIIQNAEPTTNAAVQVKMLKDAVARVMAVCEEKNHLLRVHIDGDGIGVAARGSIGDSNDLVECAVQGEPLDIAFNGRLLAEALSAVAEEEAIFQFTSNTRPVMIKPAAGDAWLHCVLPVRTFN